MEHKERLFSVTKKDLNITFFSGHGAGGQNRNRHMNCVMLNHKASGTMVTGQSNKAKKSNIQEALNNLVKAPKFKIWHARRTKECLDKTTIEEEVEEMILPHNLKVEKLVNEKWCGYVEEEGLVNGKTI